MSRVIFFDWDKGVWQVVLDNGTVADWDGGVFDDANHTHDYTNLPSGANQMSFEDSWTCSHDWVTYDSGFRTFDYCKKCDVKRENS